LAIVSESVGSNDAERKTMNNQYVKYFTATIKVEGDSDEAINHIGRNIQNWIDDTLIDDSMFTDGSGDAVMVSWRENDG